MTTPTTAELLAEALRLAELGYRVFPCRSNKKPANEHGCTDATDDEDQIRRWWSEPWNIGISTDGLLVVDIDPIPNPTKLSKRKWLGNPWPTPPEHQLSLGYAPSTVTPRGGRHFFFSDDACEFRNTQSAIAPKVDTRGSGGYVVAPPSTTTVGSYSWVSELPPRGDLDPVPDWVRAELAGAPGAVLPFDGGKRGKMSDEEWLEKIGTPRTEGDRNGSLASIVGKWKSQDFSPAEILGMARDWNSRNLPPMDDTEVVKTVRSIHDTAERSSPSDPRVAEKVEELKALAGGELDPVLTRQLDKVARKVAETKRGAEESAAVRAMDAATATEYLRNAFAWLPDPIERVEQDRTHAGHETYWFVMMSGRRIELGPCLSVMNCRLTESKIIPATTLVMPVEMKKKGAWAPVASAIFRAAVVLDPDWSPDVDIMEWVRAYAEFAKDGEWEAAHYARLPHIRDGELRVQAEKMSEWVFTDRAQRVGRKELSKLLESIGMHRRQITAKHPTASTGRRVGRSFHCGPASLLGGE